MKSRWWWTPIALLEPFSSLWWAFGALSGRPVHGAMVLPTLLYGGYAALQLREGRVGWSGLAVLLAAVTLWRAWLPGWLGTLAAGAAPGAAPGLGAVAAQVALGMAAGLAAVLVYARLRARGA